MQNSIVKLIKLCASDQPEAVFRSIKKPDIAKLEHNQQYAKLNAAEKDYVRQIVKKCCRIEEEQLNLHDYLLHQTKCTRDVS